MATCNISSLIAANPCFMELSEKQQWVVIAALLCQFSGGGGGGGGVFAGNYAGGQPNFTPTTTAAIAFDTSNGTQWNWYNNQWN